MVQLEVGGEVVADGAVHHGLGVVDAGLVQGVGVVVVVGLDVADGHQELLFLVLDDGGQQLGVVELARQAEENLALAVDDVFLQVQRQGLGGAEVLGVGADGYAGLLAEPEVVVHGRAGREDDAGVVGQVDFLLAELAGRKALHLDERTEVDFHPVAGGDVEVWRFTGLRFRLRNQYFLDLHIILLPYWPNG